MRRRVSSVVKYATDDVEFAKTSKSSINSCDFHNSTLTVQPISFDATIVWERTATGYRIGDLHSNRTNTALELINSSFFQAEPTSTTTLSSSDTTSLKNYRQFLTTIVREGNSLCALREGTGKLVGAAIGSIVLRTNENDIISEDDAPSIVLTMKKRIFAEIEVKNILDGVEKYLTIYAICVDPEHRGKGVGTALLRSCVAKMKFLNLSICLGAFSSDASRRIGNRLGFEKLADIPYANYTAESQDKPLAGVGPGNYSLACMAVRIITETETTLPTHNSPTPTNAPKKSRKR